MLIWLVLSILGFVEASYYIHSSQTRHNHHSIESKEWSQEHDTNRGLPWQMNSVEGDVMKKYHSDFDGLLHLPGGCEITAEQYERLQEFQRDTHYVQNCYCQDEEVFCKLKQSGQHVQIT